MRRLASIMLSVFEEVLPRGVLTVSNVLVARKQNEAWSLLAGLIALLSYAIIHRAGMGYPQDGSAYWQGAISVLEGNGYRYFSGNPILAWPPLYSVYLSGWTALLGPTVLA